MPGVSTTQLRGMPVPGSGSATDWVEVWRPLPTPETTPRRSICVGGDKAIHECRFSDAGVSDEGGDVPAQRVEDVVDGGVVASGADDG